MASNYYQKKINYFRLYVLELEQAVRLLMSASKFKLYAGRYDEETNTIWINESIRNAYKGKGEK